MQDSNAHIQNLKNEIIRLEVKIDSMSKDMTRLAKGSFESNQLIRKHLDLIDRDVASAFERIKKIELKVFPHLAGDIVDLHKIIGDGDDNSDNPLDRRKK